MLSVTADDCGEWITGYDKTDTLPFYIYCTKVIGLAISHGMDVSPSWEADRAVVLAGVMDEDTLKALDELYFDSVEYLNDLLPENFWFESEQWGLYLLCELPDGTVIGY